MFDLIDLLNGLSPTSNNNEEDRRPKRDKIIQIISIFVGLGCVLLGAHLLHQAKSSVIRDWIILLVVFPVSTTILFTFLFYKVGILRDIMPMTLLYFLAASLSLSFTAVLYAIT